MPEWIQINAIDVVAARHGRGLRRGDDVQARRLPSVPLQDDRLRQDLDEDRDRHPGSRASRASCARTRSRRGLLYAGTELGLYVSFDDGASWQPFQRNLPVDADHRPDGQGRRPRRRDAGPLVLGARRPDAAARLQGRDPRQKRSISSRPRRRSGFRAEASAATTTSAEARRRARIRPRACSITYWLKDKPRDSDKLTVEILDGDTLLRSYTNEKKDKDKGKERADDDDRADKPLEPKAGLNRIVWDMRILRPTLLPKAISGAATADRWSRPASTP